MPASNIEADVTHTTDRPPRRHPPRSAHRAVAPEAGRPDPVQILIDQGAERIQHLLPVRYARMAADPFAFYRGGAAIMAADLARLPATELRLQTSGDAHLANFGAYASQEGTPVFDLNDFDETLPAPFEWDVKRLAASLAVAGRVASQSDKACRKLARAAAASYRGQIANLAALPPLDAWSSRIDLAAAIGDIEPKQLRSQLEKHLAATLTSGRAHFNLVDSQAGNGAARHARIKDKPPLVEHDDAYDGQIREAFASYTGTLQEDRRVLLSRYRLADTAFKVVGIGSVGTFCAIGLFVAADRSPLLLQIKQAQASALARHAGASAYANQGERVVTGQRMLQAASDVFLGWTQRPLAGRDFYVRRLKDSRLANIGTTIEAELPFYATLCGRTLARAHARAGDAAAITAYLGQSTSFDEAIGDFAVSYADQNEKDCNRFLAAIESGRITAAST